MESSVKSGVLLYSFMFAGKFFILLRYGESLLVRLKSHEKISIFNFQEQKKRPVWRALSACVCGVRVLQDYFFFEVVHFRVKFPAELVLWIDGVGPIGYDSL